jgi:hypothetical protein
MHSDLIRVPVEPTRGQVVAGEHASVQSTSGRTTANAPIPPHRRRLCTRGSPEHRCPLAAADSRGWVQGGVPALAAAPPHDSAGVAATGTLHAGPGRRRPGVRGRGSGWQFPDTLQSPDLSGASGKAQSTSHPIRKTRATQPVR